MTGQPGAVTLAGAWQPLTRPPRHPFVVCHVCRSLQVNISSGLRGWQQSATWRSVYRCPACSSGEASDR